MAINFNALPQESGSGMAPGTYKCKVVDVKMRQPADKAKPEYMQLTYELYDYAGNKKGKMVDNFYDSDAQVFQFKFGRLNYAAGLNLVSAIELKDLAKLMPGKEYVVNTIKDKDKDGKESGFLTADIFGGQIFHRLDEFADVIGHDDSVPFINAPDATDAVAPAAPTPTTTQY
jgi:hypothetical protein